MILTTMKVGRHITRMDFTSAALSGIEEEPGVKYPPMVAVLFNDTVISVSDVQEMLMHGGWRGDPRIIMTTQERANFLGRQER